jgi:hypothetical protein
MEYCQCDQCEGWFHPECVGTTIEDVEKLDRWVCPGCTRRSRRLQEKAPRRGVAAGGAAGSGGGMLTKRQQAKMEAQMQAEAAAAAAAFQQQMQEQLEEGGEGILDPATLTAMMAALGPEAAPLLQQLLGPVGLEGGEGAEDAPAGKRARKGAPSTSDAEANGSGATAAAAADIPADWEKLALDIVEAVARTRDGDPFSGAVRAVIILGSVLQSSVGVVQPIACHCPCCYH